MTSIWQFSVQAGQVNQGMKQRRMLTSNGCNEPFKDRYWCPKKQWFMKEACPFIDRRECSNYARMSGEKLAFL